MPVTSANALRAAKLFSVGRVAEHRRMPRGARRQYHTQYIYCAIYLLRNKYISFRRRSSAARAVTAFNPAS
jgi:hypothetical protein